MLHKEPADEAEEKKVSDDLMKKVNADLYYASYSLPTYHTVWSAQAFLETTVIPIILIRAHGRGFKDSGVENAGGPAVPGSSVRAT